MWDFNTNVGNEEIQQLMEKFGLGVKNEIGWSGGILQGENVNTN